MNIVYTLRVGGFCSLENFNLQVDTVLGVHGLGLEIFVLLAV